MGFPRGMAERIIEKCRTWWVHSLRNIQGTAHAQRRDTSHFDLPGDQSDGLMADGSHRDEQHGVNVFSQEMCCKLRRQFLLDTPGGVDAAHEGIGVGRQRTDHPFTHQAT